MMAPANMYRKGSKSSQETKMDYKTSAFGTVKKDITRMYSHKVTPTCGYLGCLGSLALVLS